MYLSVVSFTWDSRPWGAATAVIFNGADPGFFFILIDSSSIAFSCMPDSFEVEWRSLKARIKTGSNSIVRSYINAIPIFIYKGKIEGFKFFVSKFLNEMLCQIEKSSTFFYFLWIHLKFVFKVCVVVEGLQRRSLCRSHGQERLALKTKRTISYTSSTDW